MANTDSWFLYILECSDQSLYTGVTNNLEARVEAHNSETGAKYTRGRTPVVVKAAWTGDKSTVHRAEYAVKQLSRKKKEALIQGENPPTEFDVKRVYVE